MAFLTNLSYSGTTLSKTVDGTTSTVLTCDNQLVQDSDNPITSGAVEDIMSNINDTLVTVIYGNHNS